MAQTIRIHRECHSNENKDSRRSKKLRPFQYEHRCGTRARVQQEENYINKITFQTVLRKVGRKWSSKDLTEARAYLPTGLGSLMQCSRSLALHLKCIRGPLEKNHLSEQGFKSRSSTSHDKNKVRQLETRARRDAPSLVIQQSLCINYWSWTH